MLFQIKTINGQKTIVPLTADTGTGAPVGSLIVVCSNILPSGYLGLGVQYDITNYPALYQVLGTDTTPTASALGLPTLSSGQYAIKATSGLTENQQENVLNTINENLSYSTTEHKTGKKWIDGKDIYSCVITAPTLMASETVLVQNVDTVINAGGSQQYLNNEYFNFPYILEPSTQIRWILRGSDLKSYSIVNFAVNNIKWWFEYTKTTD